VSERIAYGGRYHAGVAEQLTCTQAGKTIGFTAPADGFCLVIGLTVNSQPTSRRNQMRRLRRQPAIVVVGYVVLLSVALFVPTSQKHHAKYACSNNGLVIIAGAQENNDPHDLAVRYCTGDIKAATKAITDKYGAVIRQWAFVYLPSSR
jgi:hypothetical protein